MMADDALRAPMSMLVLVNLAADLGIAEKAVLAGTGLTPTDLRETGAEVRASQELRAIENLLAAAPNAATIGLDAGLRYHLTTYGIWGFAMVSASTFRESIDVGLRYLDLTFTFAPIRAEEMGTDLRLVLEEEPSLSPDVARFVVQRDATAIQTLQRETLGWPANPRSVDFRHEIAGGMKGPVLTRYRETLGIAPTFGADRNVVVLDAANLDAPLPQADPHTAAMTQQMCEDLVDARKARAGLAGRVRNLIVAQLRPPPSLPDVAAILQMSPRTLRRRLASEDTTMRQLIDEVRAALAAELITGGRLTVAEVARRLGYVEVSSFSQAFRRWYGMSPRAFRDR
ncbi:MAG: AraC family transcriptional regulator ligand-binding domain-containing protein [Aeromicrobium sp.]